MAHLRDITTIRLGARVYQLRWDAENVEALRQGLYANDVDEDDIPSSAWGMIDHGQRIICLDPGCLSTPLTAFEILMHEAVHAIEAFLGLDLDESKVEALAAGISSMLIQSGFLAPEDYSVCGVKLAPKKPAEDASR